MHAAAVEVLIEKSKFEPHVALGIAEAIDMVIQSAQLITVPMLDARLAALEQRLMEKIAGLDGRMGSFETKMEARIGGLETKMESIKAELVRWVFLVMLGNVAITAGITAALNALQR
jgi:hypothetical protein